MSAYVNDIARPKSPTPTEARPEDAIPVDGYQQVLEMLRIADPAFRDSLLRRIAARDRGLAMELKRQIEI